MHTVVKSSFLCIVCCAALSLGAGQKESFPGKDWQVLASPAEMGWSVEKLDEARQFTEGINTDALMIVHRGVVVDQWGNVDRPLACQSMRKSLLSALIGPYVAAGKIDLSKTLEELGIDDNDPALTPTEKSATVADLLTARSGVYHPAAYEPRNMIATRPERGAHAPGTHFFYNNWDFNALLTIYEQETGAKIFEDFEKRFVKPLQMQDYDERYTRYLHERKSEHPAYLFALSARDLARVGLLFSRDGRWKRKQVVPVEWVRESTFPHVENVGRRGSYGYMWWVATPGTKNLFGIETEDGAFCAAGAGGQRLFVFPESDLVIVHRVNNTVPGRNVSHADIARLMRLILSACPPDSTSKSNAEDSAMWEAWARGDIEDAHALARARNESSPGDIDAHRLLMRTTFVKGGYEDALSHYAEIANKRPLFKDEEDLVLNAYLNLRRYAEAEQFAREAERPELIVETISSHRERPFKATLQKVSVVPFAKHPLTPFFPAFNAELEGEKVRVHVDTGGTFLHMNPKQAERLGIEFTKGGEGFHGANKVDIYYGIAERFVLGAAVFENVPVAVMPSLAGSQDFIIFGTSILQPFLSTLDYPNDRLILSPRGDAGQRKKHLAMLPGDAVHVPFYMWGDHYMFARGAVGEHAGLNFFIDSGLVSLHPDGEGGMRQAAFTTSASNFALWGYPDEDIERKVFESRAPLSLGPLRQDDLLLLVGKVGTSPFGGVQMHGLLSHAFLKNYSWTLDFDERTYLFSH